MAFFLVLFVVLIVLVTLFRLYVNWCHNYWDRKNVPYIEPTLFFGNIGNPFTAKRALMFDVKDVYDALKTRGYQYGGMYFLMEPFFVPVDANLIKHILMKDFPHFMDHGLHFDEKKDPLAAHLFNLEGDRWRNMRVKLTPTFTSGKMKMMFKTLLDCGVPMIDHVDNLCRKGVPLDVKEILACYTTDIIGSCAFGLECNSFKDPNAKFRSYGRKVLMPTFWNAIRQFFMFCSPVLRKYLPGKILPMEIEKFFLNTVKNIIDYRTANEVKRNDFIQLFMEIQEKAKARGEEGFTLKEITAQTFVFFVAGFETSSTTMTFALHELAFNQDIQDKLREEVRKTLNENNGELTYDAIMGMKYMDQVVNETLRKYPPVPFLNRVCSLDYNVPNTDLSLKKGDKVIISSYGLHRDEEYYPNPDKFDPERFSDENKATRPVFTFLPFGEGPRLCIGLRFGLMQTKTGLSMLLNNYRIFPTETESYNINFDPRSFILTKKGSVMLRAVKLST